MYVQLRFEIETKGTAHSWTFEANTETRHVHLLTAEQGGETYTQCELPPADVVLDELNKMGYTLTE